MTTATGTDPSGARSPTTSFSEVTTTPTTSAHSASPVHPVTCPVVGLNFCTGRSGTAVDEAEAMVRFCLLSHPGPRLL